MEAGGPRVVVADDDPGIRLLCRVNLEHEGFRVVEAASAEELALVLGVEAAALILLDVRLGRDDGIEVARRIRADHPETPIAFFTGTEPMLAGDARGLADGLVPKPFSLEELIGTVRRLARA
jgi:two-component system OmpR family response regulator